MSGRPTAGKIYKSILKTAGKILGFRELVGEMTADSRRGGSQKYIFLFFPRRENQTLNPLCLPNRVKGVYMSQIQMRWFVRILQPKSGHCFAIAAAYIWSESQSARKPLSSSLRPVVSYQTDAMDVDEEVLLGLYADGVLEASDLPAELQLPRPAPKRYRHSRNIRAPVAERQSAPVVANVQRSSATGQDAAATEDIFDPPDQPDNEPMDFGHAEGVSGTLEELFATLEQEMAELGLVPIEPAVGPEEPVSRWQRKAEAQHAAWQAVRPYLHQQHIQNQAVPEAGVRCESCSVNAAVLKCLECGHGGKLLCGGCDAALHSFAHFHRRRVFGKGFWEAIPPNVVFTSEGVQEDQGMSELYKLVIFQFSFSNVRWISEAEDVFAGKHFDMPPCWCSQCGASGKFSFLKLASPITYIHDGMIFTCYECSLYVLSQITGIVKIPSETITFLFWKCYQDVMTSNQICTWVL